MSATDRSKPVNVEIAPRNQRRLDELIARHNRDPHRTRATLTYTDVINDALREFFEANGWNPALESLQEGGQQ